MPKLQMTKLGVERLKPPAKGQVDYFDTVMPGLLLRVSYGGTKAWRVIYYKATKAKYVTLGRYPAIDLIDARNKARDILKLVAEGGDPKTPKSRAPDTIDKLLEEFVEKHVKPNCRTSREIERLLRKEVLEPWKGRLAADISRRDVLDLTDGILDRPAPYVANHTHAFMRKMFNWAVERGILEINPMTGLRKPAKVMSRDRVITDDELRTIWAAWEEVPEPWGAYFRVLLLTGQRRGEVAQMRWQDVDTEERVWSIPREFTKANRAHRVPLSDLLIDILVDLPRYIEDDGSEGEFVFSTTRGKIPTSAHSQAKVLADDAIAALVASGEYPKVWPWRVHDLRRTAATGMAKLGTAPHVLSAILNHAPSTSMGITAVYLRHTYDDEKRVALDAWARHLDGLFDDKASNVVAFPR